jgi:hypothetical protein
MLCGLAGICPCFGATYCHNPEYGDIVFLRNIAVLSTSPHGIITQKNIIIKMLLFDFVVMSFLENFKACISVL